MRSHSLISYADYVNTMTCKPEEAVWRARQRGFPKYPIRLAFLFEDGRGVAQSPPICSVTRLIEVIESLLRYSRHVRVKVLISGDRAFWNFAEATS